MRAFTPKHRRGLESRVVATCENRPGVYRMLAEDGTVLYVGTSRGLRTRLLSYFRASGRRNRQARILRHAFDLDWEYAPDAFGALVRELRLIKQHRPPFNVMHVDDEAPRAYVALLGGPVPGLRIVRRTDDPRDCALWGPFRAATRLAEAVRTLAEVAGVRDCALDGSGDGSRPPSLFFGATGEGRAPGCFRLALGSCPGPCVGGGERAAYLEAVASVRAFLDGKADAPLRLARERMRSAAAALEFERAAAWRDRSERLTWLFRRLRSFHASMDRLTFRYVARGPGGETHVYLLRRGTLRGEAPAPRSAEERDALERLARRVYGHGDPDGDGVPLHDLEEFHVVASFFRRHPDELARTLPALPVTPAMGTLRAS